MATITDATYYEKGINFIPNSKDISPSDSPSQNTGLLYFIDLYERELMLNALGITLYTDLQTALKDLEKSEGKWQDLVKGKTYELNSKTYRWEGLRGYNKNSLVASYIFCKWLRNDESVYTTTGIAQNVARNATNFSFTPKYIASWNQFFKRYQAQAQNAPKIIYNHFGAVGLDYYQHNNSEVSLYQYLTDQNEIKATSFPDFEFKFYKPQNSFGI